MVSKNHTLIKQILAISFVAHLTSCGVGGDDTPRTTGNLSGTITATATSVSDGDVNDPLAPYLPNDSTTSAQLLTNPSVVGGFASAQGTGSPGDRFSTNGDINDYYTVTLEAGQTATLFTADAGTSPGGDLDLFLYSTSAPNTVVDESRNTTSYDTVTAPNQGSYYVRVHAFGGISNYVLFVGDDPIGGAANTGQKLSALRDFAPYEFIVQFKNGASALANSGSTLRQKAASLGLGVKAGSVDRAVLLNADTDAQRAQAFQRLGIKPMAAMSSTGLGAQDDRLRAKADTIQLLKALRLRDDIKSVDLNYVVNPFAVPNDPQYRNQWHYPLINLPQAWDITQGSSNVIVAVVDTGVVMSHPDLAGNLTTTGYDFISDLTIAADGNGIDNNPDDPGDGLIAGSSSFHGTHVSGTIAAVSNNNVGVAGIAWDSRIMPLRALGKGGGLLYDIMQAVRYAAGLSNDSGITLSADQRADIINLSLGGPDYAQFAQDIFTEVYNSGVIVVAAAGNEGTSQLSYPASYNGVVSVSAVDKSKGLTFYSNYGTMIDVAAPGGDMSVIQADGILSTAASDSFGSIINTYGYLMGTSMASPHMAGVVALMKSVYPGLTPEELDTLIQSGLITEDLANNGVDVRDNSFGYGLIDAIKAVNEANRLNNGAPLPGVLRVTPNRLDFAYFQDTATLNASVIGGTNYSITAVNADATWLSVSPRTVDANGLGDYQVAVTRGTLADGVHRANITFTADIDGSISTVSVPVSMQVGIPVTLGDAGYHYILVFDPVSRSAVAQVHMGSNNGEYNFAFSEIPNGDYYIIAGTDFDNDGYICDSGEACGGYPLLSQLTQVTVDNNTTSGLDFTTSFSYFLGANAAAASPNESRGFSRLVTKKLW